MVPVAKRMDFLKGYKNKIAKVKAKMFLYFL